MKILVVARYKEHGFAPFVTEQVAALEKAGVGCRFFPVRSKGITGYLKQLPELKRVIKKLNPDVVHAHYGLCGLFANLQRRVPVVTTYHGSDINEKSVLRLSKIAIRLSAFNVFVSQKIIDTAKPKRNYALIPCGINLEDYPIIEKVEARKQLGLESHKKYILFAGAFDNIVKNAPLAKEAVACLNDENVQLLELKGYSRPQVALLMQAVDAFLMTSVTEGSPQVIKEALACGCPIVSVDVGDVKERIERVDGCFIAKRDADDLAKCLKKAIAFDKRTNGKDTIMRDGLINDAVASQLKDIYAKISKNQ
jgi:glycosyltransferase involved in cell wall biosynthesis